MYEEVFKNVASEWQFVQEAPCESCGRLDYRVITQGIGFSKEDKCIVDYLDCKCLCCGHEKTFRFPLPKK